MTEIILDDSNICCGCDGFLRAKEIEGGFCRECQLVMDTLVDLVHHQLYAGVISK